MKSGLVAVVLLALALSAGCTSRAYGPNARNGIVFYVPGAGNIDFGDAGLRQGLNAAGYHGEVASVAWTVLFNPLIDQKLLINAKAAAADLANAIADYQKKYPGRPVHLVGLSAGTGISVWTLEDLREDVMVDNVVLLASSLSYDYDLRKAAGHVKGRIYNYFSPSDAVLAGPMKLVGTIDGKIGTDGAGAVGFRNTLGGKVINVGWKSEFSRYGYYGGHTDATSAPFVTAYLAAHLRIDQPGPGQAHQPALASHSEIVLQDAHPD